MKFIRRAGHPDPANWFESWLEHYGAGHAERHAGAVFVRQMAVSAMLLGLTDVTGLNFGAYGIDPRFVAGLWLTRQFFPDDKRLRKWLKTGAYDMTINWAARGIPLGPTVEMATGGITKGFHWVATRGQPAKSSKAFTDPKSGGLDTWFPLDAVLEVARKNLLVARVEIERLARENPEAIEKLPGDIGPWVFKALGIKRAQYGASSRQKLLHHVGLSTPSEDRSAERKVPQP